MEGKDQKLHVVTDNIWNFRPLFTLQPVRSTREKQLKIWDDLILKFCRENKVTSIIPNSFALFENTTIERSLNVESRNAVIQHLISNGIDKDIVF